MLDSLPNPNKKLAPNFVEEAGVRCFGNQEFKDWFVAIHHVLLESGIILRTEVINEIFSSLPHSADDEVFELTLKVYLIDKKLLTRAQVEGEEWDQLFSQTKEVAWVDENALGALHADPELKARLEGIHGNVDNQLAS